jgi:hypothetical protein
MRFKTKQRDEKLQKAVKNLLRKGVSAYIEGGETIYIDLNDVHLEISEFEINFQSKEWDENPD